MSTLRKIVDEKDARACLSSVAKSSETVGEWARRHGVDGLAMGAVKAFRAIDVAPRQTIETLEENKQWLKNQASR